MKNYPPFGARSANLLEIMDQAANTIRVAQANPLSGTAPEVVFRFPQGISMEAYVQLRTVRVNGQSLIIEGPIVALPHPVPVIPPGPENQDR